MKTACMTLLVAAASAADLPCTTSNNAYHSDEGCFCKEGFLPASYIDGGLPCLPISEAKSKYCMEDGNAFWISQKSECFCSDGHQASKDSPHHGHPCKPKTHDLEQACNNDKNAYWDGHKIDCLCNVGYGAASKRDASGFFHPCEKVKTEL